MVRANFSVLHLLSAREFANQVASIETEHVGEGFGGFWESIFASASATVLLAVAAVEAYVNETFVDFDQNFANVDPILGKALVNEYEAKRLLDKAELILLLKGVGPLDRGSEPVQSMSDLIQLRNAITHFRPEWPDQLKEHEKLSERLGRRFPKSPFLPNEAMFPMAWAGAYGVDWAAKTPIRFIDRVVELAGLPNRLEKHKGRLLG